MVGPADGVGVSRLVSARAGCQLKPRAGNACGQDPGLPTQLVESGQRQATLGVGVSRGDDVVAAGGDGCHVWQVAPHDDHVGFAGCGGRGSESEVLDQLLLLDVWCRSWTPRRL